MNEIQKFNKNAKVEKFTNMLGIAVRLIVIDPLLVILWRLWNAIIDHVLTGRLFCFVENMKWKKA